VHQMAPVPWEASMWSDSRMMLEADRIQVGADRMEQEHPAMDPVKHGPLHCV
jgi:hypothetical protein